ncbi:hypothetical protein [Salipaludibacillus sp. CF4.18]|uniref:hypothetical protein n=1 Tax=Salipaludibacillus sp. CF4.18 TaxID=3373081 RepID=UPI003EE7A5F8
MKKAFSEQEWVYQYYLSGKKKPVILGTKGTWVIGGNKAIILIAFSFPDMTALKTIHCISNKHPIREVKYKDLRYYAVNIVDQDKVLAIIKSWNC